MQLWKTLYVPNLSHNLFSMTQAMNNGCIIYGEKDLIKIAAGGKEILFGVKTKTKNGFVLAGIIKPFEARGRIDIAAVIQENDNKVVDNVNKDVDNNKDNNVNLLQPPKDNPRTPTLSNATKCLLKHVHDCFIHPNDDRTRVTCKKLGIMVSGNYKNCSACAQAKIQQTRIQTDRTQPCAPSNP